VRRAETDATVSTRSTPTADSISRRVHVAGRGDSGLLDCLAEQHADQRHVAGAGGETVRAGETGRGVPVWIYGSRESAELLGRI
jgi:hypothetical protein